MGSRTKQMKVIVGGMPRTSTVSITSALRRLGFYPYDYFTRLERGHLRWWNDRLRMKCQGHQVNLNREEMDRLTGEFDCISDAPCFFLVQELAQVYPEAKILLNERDLAPWLASIAKTLQPSFEADKKWIYRITRLLDPTFTRPIMICDELQAALLCDSDYSNKAKFEERYAAHYRSLSQLGERRILRYRVQEGWISLCQFLNLPVPDRNFPRENDANHLLELGRLASRKAVMNSLRNCSGGAFIILILGMILVYLADQLKRGANTYSP